ncbi:MAG: site-specific DNA-methyltransferase [Christensenellaceae bacterium]|jgi:DNA modification methylase|nr:site-specific DNA-methyltransferase [Christensenellaceae bacterium]
MVKTKNNSLFDGQEAEKTIIRNCDCKDLFIEMKNKGIKVNAIITDPPYCVSRDHQRGFSNMGRSGMNYGKWDYGFDHKQWILDCADLLVAGGAFIIFTDWKNASYIVEALEEKNCLVKDLIRWEKANPMPRNVDSRYVMDFEVAIWAVKAGKKWTFNKPTNVSYLKPVYKSGVVLGKKRIHPTQKNLEVVIDLIKVHTNKDDLILDPFFGSATTAVACRQTERRFFGAEIDETYYNKAKDRLNDLFTTELHG